jgi:hypothetical protein
MEFAWAITVEAAEIALKGDTMPSPAVAIAPTRQT